MIFRGGGQEDFALKKISGSDFREKKNSPLWAGKKKFQHASGSAFALRKVFSVSQKLFSQSDICFLHSLNSFSLSENYIIYLGNDFSHYKIQIFCSFENSLLYSKTLPYAKNYHIHVYVDAKSPSLVFMKISFGSFLKKIFGPKGPRKKIPAPKMGKIFFSVFLPPPPL